MPSPCLAIDPMTSLPIADYTWLPKALQATYHAILELDEGVALIHFAGCVDVLPPPNNNATTPTTNHITTRMKVLLLSTDALYFCSSEGDILRCVLLSDIDDLVTCDEWICCCCPGTYDIAFRFDTSHLGESSPSRRVTERALLIPRHQGHFVAIINGLRQTRDLAPLLPVVVHSHYSIATRNLARPRGLPKAPPPPPIPFLSFDEIRTSVENPNVLIDCFTFQHRLLCPRVEAWELKRRQSAIKDGNDRLSSRTSDTEEESEEVMHGGEVVHGGDEEDQKKVRLETSGARGTHHGTAVSNTTSKTPLYTGTGNATEEGSSRFARLAAILDDDHVAVEPSGQGDRRQRSTKADDECLRDDRPQSAAASDRAARDSSHSHGQRDTAEVTLARTARPMPDTQAQSRLHDANGQQHTMNTDRASQLSYMHPTTSSRVKSEQIAMDRKAGEAERQGDDNCQQQKREVFKVAIRPAQRPKKNAAREASPSTRIQLSPRRREPSTRDHNCRTPTAASVAKRSEKRISSAKSPLRRVASPNSPMDEKMASRHHTAPHQLKDKRLSLVWEELVAQKRSLDYLTRHVEGLLFPQQQTSPTSHRMSPQQEVRPNRSPPRSSKIDKLDNSRGSLVNVPRHIDVSALSEYQRSLLLRPSEGPYANEGDGKRGSPQVMIRKASPPRAVQIHNKVDEFVHLFTSTAPSVHTPPIRPPLRDGSAATKSPHHLKMTKSALGQNVLLNKQTARGPKAK